MPSTTKTRQTRRAPKPKPPRAAPVTQAAETPPAPPAPVEPSAPIVIETPVAPAPVEPVAPAAPALVDMPVSPEPVRLGQVQGLLHRTALSEVQFYLEDVFGARIAMLRDSQPILELQERVRATEGRCAPIYFTTDDDGEPEHLVSGIETVAAAINLGLEYVFVVTVSPDDIGPLQSFLAVQAADKGPASPEDDFIIVMAAPARK